MGRATRTVPQAHGPGLEQRIAAEQTDKGAPTTSRFPGIFPGTLRDRVQGPPLTAYGRATVIPKKHERWATNHRESNV
ncbi:hypothetical protein VTG60DRAFT_126 [Thermothelomyces hinnuleus]